MNDVGVIDTFLNTFTSYIDSGFGLVRGEVTGLSSILIALDITLAGLFWAWGADEDVMRRLVRKTLAIGFFAWIIGNFNALAKIVFESFAGLGLKAGGSAIGTAEFLRPGRLAEVGLTAGQPLLDAASQLTGPVALFVNAVQITVLLVSWLLILIAFFILAVQLFVTLIEFKLTTLAGFVLIPFAFFGKTAFLAEKVLGNIVASGVKVMVLAVIVGIGSGLFSQFTASYGDAQPTISQALSAVLAALALLGLGIFGPGIATGLITGAPQLGAGAAVGTGLAAGGAALAGAGAAGLAVRGAGAALSGTAAAARAGASLAGGAASAYSVGAAGQSGLSGVAGGLGGVARAGATPATSPLRGSAGAPPASGANPTSPSTPASSGDVPDWARCMRRSQQMAHGIQTATHAVRSGDSHGGGSSISLSESDHP
ncbi:P-type conjugative transfer protein TrbL [Xanthobacter autotrophicus]|uniref:P-type conjugative transfer protein TrbL n=1 Tax=Xanthobacter autotrophicus TaxID=280 RepID=UPI00372766EB